MPRPQIITEGKTPLDVAQQVSNEVNKAYCGYNLKYPMPSRDFAASVYQMLTSWEADRVTFYVPVPRERLAPGVAFEMETYP